MDIASNVIEYNCPCCGAGLSFGADPQKLVCQYCDNTFDIDAIKAINETAAEDADQIEVPIAHGEEWSESDKRVVHSFTCPSCGGELITDENTAATFCPFCDNPTILEGRVSNGVRPEGVIPFKTTKEDAKNAFLALCKGKPLLPKDFTANHRLEKITGIYVPFWLYDCDSVTDARYKATRIHTWADSHYTYTRTEHFMLIRGARGGFQGIPMDGSSKMDDTTMESIEPFDYSQMVDFDTAYLSGFFADKYDVESDAGKERIRQRVHTSMDQLIQPTLIGYSSVLPTSRNLQVSNTKAKYVLLPVWLLNTKYAGETYTFAMNGQTGKMTGTFPICPKKSLAWFSGICAGVTLLGTLLGMMNETLCFDPQLPAPDFGRSPTRIGRPT